MGRAAAIGIHNDLAPGQAAVAVRTAHNKAPGGVHIKYRVFVHQFRRHSGLNHFFNNILPQSLQFHIGAVLAGYNHGGHLYRLAVVILHGHLGLAVCVQIWQGAVLPHLGQLHSQFIGQTDGQRHQLRGLVAGITEHHTLVTGAVQIIGILLIVL